MAALWSLTHSLTHARTLPPPGPAGSSSFSFFLLSTFVLFPTQHARKHTQWNRLKRDDNRGVGTVNWKSLLLSVLSSREGWLDTLRLPRSDWPGKLAGTRDCVIGQQFVLAGGSEAQRGGKNKLSTMERRKTSIQEQIVYDVLICCVLIISEICTRRDVMVAHRKRVGSWSCSLLLITNSNSSWRPPISWNVWIIWCPFKVMKKYVIAQPAKNTHAQGSHSKHSYIINDVTFKKNVLELFLRLVLQYPITHWQGFRKYP